jgi:ATP-binding cassette subfamily B protein
VISRRATGAAVLQIVIVLAVMFYLNTTLALLVLAPFSLLIAGALTYTLTAHRRYRLQRWAASAMNALLHDNLSGVRQIKSVVHQHIEISANELSRFVAGSAKTRDESHG